METIIDTQYPMVKLVDDCLAESWKDWYVDMGKDIQKEFPDYVVLISGGSYRGYDISVDYVDKERKKIRIDCYLPMYIDSDDCVEFAIDYVKNVVES